MAWADFDGKAYSRDEFAAHVAKLRWTEWKPEGITLHNTAAPTLAQWAESGPRHDARIKNLQAYYENELGWHAGPHLFISRNFINGFSNLRKAGVHSRCFNASRIGIEMVGDYGVEEFDTGDGAMVRDNAVFAMAVLCRKLKLSPSGLVFHKECKKDNHDCPGRKVDKGDIIRRLDEVLRGLSGEDPPQLETGVVSSADGSLNLRVGAGIGNPVVAILVNGDDVTIRDRATVGNTTWLYVETSDGRVGWGSARYVQVVNR